MQGGVNDALHHEKCLKKKKKYLISSGHFCFVTCNDRNLKLEQESKGKLRSIVVGVLPFVEKQCPSAYNS